MGYVLVEVRRWDWNERKKKKKKKRKWVGEKDLGVFGGVTGVHHQWLST